VLYGAAGTPNYAKVADVAQAAIGLVVGSLPAAIRDPRDTRSRDRLCPLLRPGAARVRRRGPRAAA